MITWAEKYLALDEVDQPAADALINAVLDTVACKAGAVIMLTDPIGDGHADFYYGGNVLLVEPLLNAGMEIGKQYFDCEKGTMQ